MTDEKKVTKRQYEKVFKLALKNYGLIKARDIERFIRLKSNNFKQPIGLYNGEEIPLTDTALKELVERMVNIKVERLHSALRLEQMKFRQSLNMVRVSLVDEIYNEERQPNKDVTE